MADLRAIGLAGWGDMYTMGPKFKRDAALCPTGYSLCPSSLNGGCCSTDQSCGTSSCYATTSAPQSACGKAGYVACGLDQGGGCCPSGFACQGNGCSPLPGVSTSQDCGPSSYLCPEAAGYGCCRSGLACGVGYCYTTSYSTVSLTVTITTTDTNSQTKTLTTVIQTAYVPQTLVTSAPSATSSAIAKITPTSAFAKVDPTSSPSSGGSGLSSGALGGIVAAAVVILLVILAASFFILRRLNTVVKQSKGSKGSKGSGPVTDSKKKSSKKPNGGGSGGDTSKTTEVDYDNMSVDPLMMSSSSTVGTPGLSRPSAVHNSSSETYPNGTSSPPIPAPYNSAFGTPHGYQQVSTSDAAYFDPQHPPRVSSQVSPQTPPMVQDSWTEPTFYPDPALRDQNLRFGHTTARPGMQYGHERQWSDTTVASQQSLTPQGPAELDAGEIPSTFQRALQSMGLSRPSAGHRRRSSEISLLGHRRNHSNGSGLPKQDTPTSPGFGQRLANVEETPATGVSPQSNIPNSASSAAVSALPQQTAGSVSELGASTGPNRKKGPPQMSSLERDLERREGQKTRGKSMDIFQYRRGNI